MAKKNTINYISLMVTYTPKYFKIQELVPPSIYNALGSKSLIVMDARMLYTADCLREHFGKPITINNWHKSGKFSQRGFRDNSSVGATYSQHRYGRALDMDIKGVTAEEARIEIVKNRNKFKYITTLESDVSWLHADCRNALGKNGAIVMVKP